MCFGLGVVLAEMSIGCRKKAVVHHPIGLGGRCLKCNQSDFIGLFSIAWTLGRREFKAGQ